MNQILKETIEAAGYTFFEEKVGSDWKQSYIKYTKLEKIPEYIPELDIHSMIANAIVREIQVISKTNPVNGVYVDEESGRVYLK